MKFFSHILLACALLQFVITGCRHSTTSMDEPSRYYVSSKPCARWFWFATEIKKPDIKYQLDWAKQNNFGGVEVIWLYPLYRYQAWFKRDYGRNYPKDTTAQKWLSAEWQDVVNYTKRYADTIGLSCDFGYGSAWPAAGSNIDKEHSTQIYGDTSFRQWLTFAWTWPEKQLVVNHLDSNSFYLFSEPVEEALHDALKGSKSALFMDSWEIKMNAKNKIWTTGFENMFQKNFGYDLIPYMEADIDSFPDVRYDYMMQLDEYVNEGFYKPLVKKCRELGAWSRVQCLAAPTDVMTSYGMVDIPETECMLNNPRFARIVSSAACLASRPMVTCETFTCIYGFPGTYLRKEQTADLKMVADAVFAQGVNKLFYIGMPYTPQGADTIDFFTTCYFGPNGSLSAELPEFNAYVEKVSGILQKGRTYTDVAVYIPYEDAVMKGALPKEKQRVWVWGEYEMRYVYPPDELEGYHPVWINRSFLEQASFQNGKLTVGDAQFSTLYIDVEYMDERALRRVLELAKQGLPVCLKRLPKEPGKTKSEDYATALSELAALKTVSEDFKQVMHHPPLLQGDSIPEYWCRVEKDGTHYVFLAQWNSKDLKYPVYCGQSYMYQSEFKKLTLTVNGKSISRNFEFAPYQSLMLKITPDGKLEFEDIAFVPKHPVIRARVKQKTYF